MKILISSLQVSEGASKGHLHPAIEIGLELQQRGHTVAILPLPSPFNREDREQIQRCQFEIIEPPPLPIGLPLPPQQLAQLEKNSLTTYKAYQSFPVSPLEYQFDYVLQKIKNFKPDIVVYDLLVYASPLASRRLRIPDVGYCAGLKLIAPSALTGIYQSTREKLAPFIDRFLNMYSMEAKFNHLELLSSTYQFVFVPESFIGEQEKTNPSNTLCVGSLPISLVRCEETFKDFNKNNRKNIVLCFGSVIDPANHPEITNIVIKMAKKFECNLFVSSRTPIFFSISEYLTISDYLPLPQLLKNASLFIHHGGANTFSEALTLGVPQILIPLSLDQPIQAEFLVRSKAGFSIKPNNVTEENMYATFQKLLDQNNPIHDRIKEVKNLYSASKGASIASDIIEKIVRSGVNL